MVERIAIGADHGGYHLKKDLVSYLENKYEITDVGADTYNVQDDYPEFAEAVARVIVSRKAERGILICGSGVGACITANKIPGVRACLCHDIYSAHQGVEHDDMNILCLGARVVAIELAKELVDAFLNANYSGEERYQRRLEKILEIEQKSFRGKTVDH
jgi:ribose 5-phosphate isomerase B